MSSCVLQYTQIHEVNLPLDIFTIRENSFSNHTALHNTTPNLADLDIHRRMHIYPWQMDPPQSSIDALNTATPHLVDIYIYIYIYI